MDAIRVLLADDHAFYREGVRTMLSTMAEIDVVGEADTGDAAIGKAAALQPDVVLMDIKMPGVNGIEATRRIVQASPHVGVLMVTMFDDDDSVFAAMRAGARGYLLKDAQPSELLAAIRSAHTGGSPPHPDASSWRAPRDGSARGCRENGWRAWQPPSVRSPAIT